MIQVARPGSLLISQALAKLKIQEITDELVQFVVAELCDIEGHADTFCTELAKELAWTMDLTQEEPDAFSLKGVAHWVPRTSKLVWLAQHHLHIADRVKFEARSELLEYLDNYKNLDSVGLREYAYYLHLQMMAAYWHVLDANYEQIKKLLAREFAVCSCAITLDGKISLGCLPITVNR